MGNQNEEESASTQPNQRLGSLSHDPTPTSSYQQIQKYDRPESPPHESHVPRQCPKRSKNANPSPPSFPAIFPLEIIVEILSNLPVESLLRFRCVHKSWKSLITDPFFVKKHLQKTQNDTKFTKKRVLINSGNTQFRTQAQSSIKSCSVTAIYKDQIVNSSEIEYPSKKASLFNLIVGYVMA
ncbi:putative F-box protein At1g47790 [Durio zibethinus]|uniref:F-box protein At1g47790 n=1 Tax=Durio zibethinus TaxID=66656 RepID=A0A6P5X375_DURZI|nr:putative F-box protein At1g47790 [Durio zibethinus]